MMRRPTTRHYSIIKNIVKPTGEHPYPTLATNPTPTAATDASSATVLGTIQGHLKILTLNRLSKLHSVNVSMVEQLTRHVQDSQKQTAVSTLLLNAALPSSPPPPPSSSSSSSSLTATSNVSPSRPPIFSSGGDIVQIFRHVQAGQLTEAMEFFRKEYRLNALIGHVSMAAKGGSPGQAVPLIAWMDGLTMGGGFGLCMHTPWRICTERTKIAMPETLIGFIPDVGSTFFFSRLSGGLPLWLLLTGAEVRGSLAKRLGLASHYIPSHRLADVRERLAGLGPLARLNDILDEFSGQEDSSDSEDLLPILPLIDRTFRPENSVADIQSRLESIAASGSEYPKMAKDWATAAQAALAKACPQSLVLTQRLLSLGRQCSSLEACLKNEYRVAVRLIREPDFELGITKRILEKQKEGRPAWGPVNEDKLARLLDPKERPDELPLTFDHFY